MNIDEIKAELRTLINTIDTNICNYQELLQDGAEERELPEEYEAARETMVTLEYQITKIQEVEGYI